MTDEVKAGAEGAEVEQEPVAQNTAGPAEVVDVVRVRILSGNAAGDVEELHRPAAEALVASGFAEYVDPSDGPRVVDHVEPPAEDAKPEAAAVDEEPKVEEPAKADDPAATPPGDLGAV